MKNQSKDFWVSVEDKTNDPDFIESSSKEFMPLPVVEGLAEDAVVEAPANRRDFLKYLGFSLGAATLAASCEAPIRKAIPYVIKPDAIVPGVATYYASSYVKGGDYCAILVKTREGRPIKIEGNALSSISMGGTSARVQASVLDLYDTNRLKAPAMDAGTGLADCSWEDLDKSLGQKLATASSIRIVSNTILSPSAKKAIAAFQARYPGTKHIMYDAVSASGLLDANEASFGDRVVPAYHFDKANVIVSVGADFLGTWISPIEYAKQYSKGRKLTSVKGAKMSRHIQVESGMSMTGSNADNRILIKPSEQGAAIATLYNEVASLVGGSRISAPAVNEKAAANLKKVAGELAANKGASLVVSGSNNKSEQIIVNRINDLLGNYGNTLSLANASMQRQGSDAAIQGLIREMNGGSVDTLMVWDANPVFELPNGAAFAEGMKKVGTRVSFHQSTNETGASCNYIAPTHHYLESWGDAEPQRGNISLIQPTIAPLFKTRQAEESLLRWANSNELDTNADQPYYEFLKAQWQNGAFANQSRFSSFRSFWDNSLHDGVVATSSGGSRATGFNSDVSAVAGSISQPGNSELEISFYETINMGGGENAGNPWLQEMPDPVTRCVWGNYLSIPVGWDGYNEYTTLNNLKDGDKVQVEVNGRSEEVTVMRTFGQMPGTVSIGLGYGRQTVGQCGKDVGTNVQPWIGMNGDSPTYAASNVSIGAVTGKEVRIPCVQHHHTYGVTGIDKSINEKINVDEKEVMEVGNGYQGSLTERSIFFHTNLKDLDAYASEIKHKREHYQHLNEKTLYPDREDYYGMGHHWGMHVDMNACIGCSACTVACMAENNVPVVGRNEVTRHHEMTWLRIDRYFYGDVENPNVVYQPMMCQHCDNAPCENVCPVAATNHSSEGLNQMAYNRCVGTRYCANNCPYKVRRFNWLDYTTADLFPVNEEPLNGEDLPFGADNLTRMVLNPDVTVRSRGVIEKCSFCVQRIQEGKLTAKKEGRKLRDADVRSACQTACPTGAITFGDMNNKHDELGTKLKSDMNYLVLEEVNTRPSVHYQIKVNNRDESFDA